MDMYAISEHDDCYENVERGCQPVDKNAGGMFYCYENRRFSGSAGILPALATKNLSIEKVGISV